MADDQLRIRLLAYRIWEAEDCPDGQAERHWHMACRLVAAERITNVPQDAQPKPAARSTKPAEPVTAERTEETSEAAPEPAAKKATAKRTTTAKRRSTAEGAEGKAAAPKKAAARTTTPRKTPAAKKKGADATGTATKRSKSSDDNSSQ